MTITTSNIAESALTIGSGASQNVYAMLSSAANSYYMGVTNADGKFRIGKGATYGLADMMTIDTGGNIGIGTSAPSSFLSFGSGAARKIGIEGSATDVVGRALTVASGSTVAGTSVSDVAGGNLVLSSGAGTGTGASSILFQTGTTGATGTTLQSISTKMTILGSGNVGIGATAPSELLNINGGSTSANLRFDATLANSESIFFADNTNGKDMTIYRPASSRDLRIATGGGTDIMSFINASGNVGIGTTTSASYHFTVNDSGTTTTRFAVSSGSNNIYAFGAAQTSWSDQRLKHDVQPMGDVMEKLDQLDPVTFQWNNNLNIDDVTHYGVIAQQIQQVFPTLVYQDQDGYLNVRRDEMQFILIKAMQEQQAKINKNTSDISTLDLRTNGNITTLSELQDSVDEKLSIVGTKLDSLDKTIADNKANSDADIQRLDSRITDQDATIDTLSQSIDNLNSFTQSIADQIQTMQAQLDALSSGSNAGSGLSSANVTFDANGNALFRGNVKTPKLETDAIVAGDYTVNTKTDGVDNKNTGSATISQGKKEVVVANTKVKNTSRIIVTPVGGSPINWIVSNKDDGVGFTIRLDIEASEDVSFDYWIVQTE